MGWRSLSDDARRWAFWIGGAVVIGGSASAVWAWWTRLSALPPPIQGLVALAAGVLALFAWWLGLAIKAHYFDAGANATTPARGPLNIHHARWVPMPNQDVTERVRAQVRQGRLDLPIDRNGLGRDPWKGQLKELVVTYSLGDGPVLTVTAKDHSQLRIP